MENVRLPTVPAQLPRVPNVHIKAAWAWPGTRMAKPAAAAEAAVAKDFLGDRVIVIHGDFPHLSGI